MDVGEILNGGPEPEWYKVPGSEAQIKIAKLNPGERRAIGRKAMRSRFVANHRIEWQDNEQANILLLDASVVDWKGIEQNGEKLPCTLDNKVALDNCWEEFTVLWNTVAARIEAKEKINEEAERGNLSTGRSSTSPSQPNTV